MRPEDTGLDPKKHCCAEMRPGSGIFCGRHPGHVNNLTDTGHKQRGVDGGNTWKTKPEEKDDYVNLAFDEAVDFTRFMGRILQEEKRSGPARVLTDSPQRLRAARHQERPLGRTRMGAPR